MQVKPSLVRGLDGRKLGTVVKSATKREVYLLAGNEISREMATRVALEHLTENEPGVTLLYVAVFRDCGTVSAPRQTKYGPLWREYREL